VAINTPSPQSLFEIQGVNNRLQLAELEREFQREQANKLMEEGATLADPARVDVRGNVTVGQDVFIDINAVFQGEVVIGANVSIGPNCVIMNASIAEGSNILANSVIEDAVIGKDCNIGPFARLRPGANLGNGCKVGNFVEIKNAQLGDGSKVNHLSYVGDADIGTGTNIGAGTITCNYDGANKFKTVMGNNVFVGSNSTLVAPVEIADGGFVAAGSTVTQTVPADNLAVGRGRQRNITGWKKPVKKKS
jgi:bifunctional UDP-N-acetylglucosamine pyrophosphorylase/glucosamine-1-phosphate N-acetyltransferase